MSILHPSSNIASEVNLNLEAFLKDFSIEVMPRTAAKIENFCDILPQQTLIYIAHIEGTPIKEMVDTAKRLVDEGFGVMPHFPARIIKNHAQHCQLLSAVVGHGEHRKPWTWTI